MTATTSSVCVGRTTGACLFSLARSPLSRLQYVTAECPSLAPFQETVPLLPTTAGTLCALVPAGISIVMLRGVLSPSVLVRVGGLCTALWV